MNKRMCSDDYNLHIYTLCTLCFATPLGGNAPMKSNNIGKYVTVNTCRGNNLIWFNNLSV